ncbi:hypothetical protein [Streptomyces sp. 891-h]|uniref:hypothetical protein n=1 Tax=Streptomyces sp. 891-h TaxID=2720714 RepID=UPI001FAA0A8E|nr:hypothetical protein [Streptomyces sp. 891-h]UNZ15727.1 hypothetical protein HC362_00055 [Streptomyces sp. 891-h]
MERFDAAAALRELGLYCSGDGDLDALDRLLSELRVGAAAVEDPAAARARTEVAGALGLYEYVSLHPSLDPCKEQGWIARIHAATAAPDGALTAQLDHPEAEVRTLAACVLRYTRGTGPGVRTALRRRLEREEDDAVRLQLFAALGSCTAGASDGAAECELRDLLTEEHDAVTRFGAALGLLRLLGADRVDEPESDLPPYVRAQRHHLDDEDVDATLLDALGECLGPREEALLPLPVAAGYGNAREVFAEHWALAPRTRVRLFSLLLARVRGDREPTWADRLIRAARDACGYGWEGSEHLAAELADLSAHGDADVAREAVRATRRVIANRTDLPPAVLERVRDRLAAVLDHPRLAGEVAQILAATGDERCLPTLADL